MSIPFIEYIRPDGQKRQHLIARQDHIEIMAGVIRSKGYDFTMENLGNGVTSLCVCNDEQGDIAIKLCREGSVDFGNAVDLLIREAFLLVSGVNKGKRREEYGRRKRKGEDDATDTGSEL